jgi:hypothetical protein
MQWLIDDYRTIYNNANAYNAHKLEALNKISQCINFGFKKHFPEIYNIKHRQTVRKLKISPRDYVLKHVKVDNSETLCSLKNINYSFIFNIL